MDGALEKANLESFEAIVEQAPNGIIFADREGAIWVWNRAAEAIFGYSAAEVLGKSLDVIIPERLRRAHWEGFRKAIETGHTKFEGRMMTTRSNHKNGSKLYVDLSFGLIRNRSGQVAGALAIVIQKRNFEPPGRRAGQPVAQTL
jgi:PAS domain S-box-containing protein